MVSSKISPSALGGVSFVLFEWFDDDSAVELLSNIPSVLLCTAYSLDAVVFYAIRYLQSHVFCWYVYNSS